MSSSFGDNKRKPGAGASAVTEARRLATIAQTWTFPSKGSRVTSGTQVAAVGARNSGALALNYAEQNGSVNTATATGTGGVFEAPPPQQNDSEGAGGPAPT